MPGVIARPETPCCRVSDNSYKDIERPITGNILSGYFNGKAVLNADDQTGSLKIGPLRVTEDLLLERYKQFDDYYLQQLAQASEYHIKNHKLVIVSKDRTALVYSWVGKN